ncbi:MAG: hypothetical protein JST17_10405 [Bacteroidetes bacterium]|nr:hypothetical protein [Bacteroidota bacterium]MBS1930306.1 hypothetical protein [Bacteroidota bacterium]
MATASYIKFPAQTLNWRRIKNSGKLWKLFFQFEVKALRSGTKTFQLVAYPAYKTRGSYSFGKKIPLEIKRPVKMYELKLPLTLGNLEMALTEMKKKLSVSQNTQLVFIPKLYKTNPHAEYLVSDGTNSIVANPSPPAKPGFN